MTREEAYREIREGFDRLLTLGRRFGPSDEQRWLIHGMLALFAAKPEVIDEVMRHAGPMAAPPATRYERELVEGRVASFGCVPYTPDAMTLWLVTAPGEVRQTQFWFRNMGVPPDVRIDGRPVATRAELVAWLLSERFHDVRGPQPYCRVVEYPDSYINPSEAHFTARSEGA